MTSNAAPAAPTPMPALAPVESPSSVEATATAGVADVVCETVADVVDVVCEAVDDVERGLAVTEVIVVFVPETVAVVVIGAYTNVGSKPLVQAIMSLVLFGRLA